MSTPANNEKRYQYFPGFALFLVENHLEQFAKEISRLSFEVDMPLLRYFKHLSSEQFHQFSVQNYTEIFNAIITNTVSEYVDRSLTLWKTNMLPLFERDLVVVEDINLSAHIRRNAFLKFLPLYTNDPNQIIELVKEIDDFIQLSVSGLFKTFITILENRVSQHVDHFKQAQAITHIGNYVWDLSKRTLIWSDEMYRIYGLNPDTDTISDSEFIATFNHPDDVTIVNENIQGAIRTLRPFDFYYRIILQDKNVKTLHAKGEIVTNSEGKAMEILGTAQDVTERQNLIMQLQKSELLFKQSQAMAHLGNWDWEIGNDKVTWSDEMYRIYGLEPQSVEINFAGFIARLHPEDRESVIEHTKRSLETGKPNEFHHRIILANGRVKILHAKSEVLNDVNGNPVQLFGSTQDVTDQMEAEHALRERTIQLQQSNASLEEFVFVASHDLKEPLRKIAMFSDRLLVGYKDHIPKEGQAYLGKINTSCGRLQDMIDDLLSLSLISGDKAFEFTNLQWLLDESLSMLDHKIEITQAQITGNKLPGWNVVPSQFRQLFQNLIANSLKFSREGVRPLITIEHRFLNTDEVNDYDIKKSARYLEITISDNGIGFDNSFNAKIFSIFQRLHSKDRYEGTGIGLAICKKIVENHAGVIKAEGVLNAGAVFRILIPDEPIK